jgi:hypothetical protein
MSHLLLCPMAAQLEVENEIARLGREGETHHGFTSRLGQSQGIPRVCKTFASR